MNITHKRGTAYTWWKQTVVRRARFRLVTLALTNSRRRRQHSISSAPSSFPKSTSTSMTTAYVSTCGGLPLGYYYDWYNTHRDVPHITTTACCPSGKPELLRDGQFKKPGPSNHGSQSVKPLQSLVRVLLRTAC